MTRWEMRWFQATLVMNLVAGAGFLLSFFLADSWRWPVAFLAAEISLHRSLWRQIDNYGRSNHV